MPNPFQWIADRLFQSQGGQNQRDQETEAAIRAFFAAQAAQNPGPAPRPAPNPNLPAHGASTGGSIGGSGGPEARSGGGSSGSRDEPTPISVGGGGLASSGGRDEDPDIRQLFGALFDTFVRPHEPMTLNDLGARLNPVTSMTQPIPPEAQAQQDAALQAMSGVYDPGVDLVLSMMLGEAGPERTAEVARAVQKAFTEGDYYQFQTDANPALRLAVDMFANPADAGVDLATAAARGAAALQLPGLIAGSARSVPKAINSYYAARALREFNTLFDEFAAQATPRPGQTPEDLRAELGDVRRSLMKRDVPPEQAQRYLVREFGVAPEHAEALVNSLADLNPNALGAAGSAPSAPTPGPQAGVISTPLLRRLLDDPDPSFIAFAEDVRYIDPRQLVGAEGNLLRNTPEQQAEFAREIGEEGFRDPIILGFDPNTNRFIVDEGNHRLQVALESGEPVPVRAWKRTLSPDAGMPLPRNLQVNRHGYYRSSTSPQDLGFEVYGPEQMLEYAAQTGDFTPEELARLSEVMQQARWMPSAQQISPEANRLFNDMNEDEAQRVFNTVADEGARVARKPDPADAAEIGVMDLGTDEAQLAIGRASQWTEMDPDDLATTLLNEGPGPILDRIEATTGTPLDPMVRRNLMLDMAGGVLPSVDDATLRQMLTQKEYDDLKTLAFQVARWTPERMATLLGQKTTTFDPLETLYTATRSQHPESMKALDEMIEGLEGEIAGGSQPPSFSESLRSVQEKMMNRPPSSGQVSDAMEDIVTPSRLESADEVLSTAQETPEQFGGRAWDAYVKHRVENKLDESAAIQATAEELGIPPDEAASVISDAINQANQRANDDYVARYGVPEKPGIEWTPEEVAAQDALLKAQEAVDIAAPDLLRADRDELAELMAPDGHFPDFMRKLQDMQRRGELDEDQVDLLKAEANRIMHPDGAPDPSDLLAVDIARLDEAEALLGTSINDAYGYYLDDGMSGEEALDQLSMVTGLHPSLLRMRLKGPDTSELGPIPGERPMPDTPDARTDIQKAADHYAGEAAKIEPYNELTSAMPHLSEIERETLIQQAWVNKDAESAHEYIDSLIAQNRLQEGEVEYLRKFVDDFADPGSDASLDAAARAPEPTTPAQRYAELREQYGDHELAMEALADELGMSADDTAELVSDSMLTGGGPEAPDFSTADEIIEEYGGEFVPSDPELWDARQAFRRKAWEESGVEPSDLYDELIGDGITHEEAIGSIAQRFDVDPELVSYTLGFGVPEGGLGGSRNLEEPTSSLIRTDPYAQGDETYRRLRNTLYQKEGDEYGYDQIRGPLHTVDSIARLGGMKPDVVLGRIVEGDFDGLIDEAIMGSPDPRPGSGAVTEKDRWEMRRHLEFMQRELESFDMNPDQQWRPPEFDINESVEAGRLLDVTGDPIADIPKFKAWDENYPYPVDPETGLAQSPKGGLMDGVTLQHQPGWVQYGAQIVRKEPTLMEATRQAVLSGEPPPYDVDRAQAAVLAALAQDVKGGPPVDLIKQLRELNLPEESIRNIAHAYLKYVE